MTCTVTHCCGPEREVAVFIQLDAAEDNMAERGDCAIYDLHGLWWTVPKELTGHQVDEQIAAALEHMDLRPFAGVPVRPHQRTVPPAS